MVKICPKCGKENSDAAKFCESCGTGLVHVNVSKKSESGSSGGLKGWWNEQGSGIKALSIIGLCFVGLLLIAGISGMMAPDKTTAQSAVANTSNSPSNSLSASSTPQSNAITVKNLEVTSGGYGDYDVTGEIIPNSDMDYLEMTLTWYDSSGAVIEKDPLAWNINDVKAGQTLKVDGSSYISDKGTPAKVDVLIFDSSLSSGDDSNAIYKQTLTV